MIRYFKTLQGFLPALLMPFAIYFTALDSKINVPHTNQLPPDSIQIDDTARIKSLIALCTKSLNRSAYDSASFYIEEACLLSRQIDYKFGLYACNNNKGLIYYNLGAYNEAIGCYQTSLQFGKELGSNKLRADSYSNLGMIYSEQGDFTKAIENFDLALALRDEDDLRGKSVAYTNLGIIYFKQGDISGALTNWLLSLEIDEKLGIPLDIAFSRNNVGMVYKSLGKYDEALNYYFSVNDICQEIGHKECQAGTKLNIGSIYEKLGKYDEALKQYSASFTIAQDIKHKSILAQASGALSQIHTQFKQYDASLTYLEHSYKSNTELENKTGLAINHLNFGYLYSQTGALDKSRTHYTEAITVFKELGLLDYIRDAYLQLSVLDSTTGNYQWAYTHFKLYEKYKDSLTRKSNKELVLELQNKFEAEKKDREIQKLNNESQIKELQLASQQDKLRLLEAERGRLQTSNLFTLQQVELLDRDKQLQQLELEKREATNLVQQSEIEKNNNQLVLMNKESEIQRMEIKKQRVLKNYFMGSILLFGFLSFFAYNYYITKQKLKLQMLRNKIASDLHDDVGSTLSSITIFSEMAKEQSKEAIPLLETIGESSRKMLDAMADIVWTINPENDQLERILLKMRSFAYELLGAKKIAFKFTSDDHISNIKLSMEVRKNLYLIFKEAANNMVKYSGADKAFFSLTEENGYLTMLIRDNGKGFNPLQDTTGNGIKNMRKRAEEIRGQLQINSTPGDGTHIELKIAV